MGRRPYVLWCIQVETIFNAHRLTKEAKQLQLKISQLLVADAFDPYVEDVPKDQKLFWMTRRLSRCHVVNFWDVLNLSRER